MRLIDVTLKLLGLSEAVLKWQSALTDLARADRARAATYCESIAETLARAAAALARLCDEPRDKTAQRSLPRELGRMKGYLDDLAQLLDEHLDGRKLAGIKKRLAGIFEEGPPDATSIPADEKQVSRLLEAEGYFRALADGLKV